MLARKMTPLHAIMALLLSSLVMSGAEHIPLYCGAVETTMRAMSRQPLLRNLRFSLVKHVELLGPVELTFEDLSFGSIRADDCDSSAQSGLIQIDVKDIHMELKSFRFSYKQQNWPHEANAANASGHVTSSFGTELDISNLAEKSLAFQISELNVKLAADADKWMYEAAAWLADHAKTAIAEIVQRELANTITATLKKVKAEGACAVARELQRDGRGIDVRLVPVEPIKQHFPTLGYLELYVNVTNLRFVGGDLSCGPMAFDGSNVEVSLSEIPIAAEFDWRYKATENNSWGRFWHNDGFGSFQVQAGCDAKVDLRDPSGADIAVHLPDLDLTIHATYDDKMYRAINAVLRPLVRKSIEAFGGRLIRKELECMADPACHGLLQIAATPVVQQTASSNVASMLEEPAAATTFVI
eukprot:TRINITY_DN23682_c0_g1_i1.p1 TRINITY_DN23682_c0_g1~~TRINITY_DN23682_c0_g1_i1.p1  ORF type:complete len:413 (+),score=82.45 TRINITY_DN23682_c0_g1_i1:184-1422(+)